MGRVYGLVAWAVVPVAVALAFAPPAGAAEPAPLRIGLPESMFSGLPPAVVQTASRPFQSMFEKQTGLKGEVAVCKGHADMADRLRAGKLDVAVFHGFEYAWLKGDAELVPLLVTVPAQKLKVCLVVNAASKADGPAALKGASVAVPNATKAYAHLYLERLREALPAGCCGTAKLDGNTVEEALDAVAGGTCPAVVVDASALAAFQRSKPGVGEQLKVLAESEAFPSAAIVYRKEAFDAQTAGKVRDGLIKGTETAQGQLLTSLWRLKGFAEVSPAYQAELDRCLKAYPAPKK